MICYGGVAATFAPFEEERLVIRIPLSSRGILYAESLVRAVDSASTGFPQEYAKGLLESVTRLESRTLLGRGVFEVCGSVHGQTGSSPWMFGVLGRSLLKLFCLQRSEISEERVIEIVRAETH